MILLNKDAILSAQDLKTERVFIKAWGGEIIVSEMGGQTLLDFYDALEADGKESVKIDLSYMATAIIHTVVDEDGALIFTMDDLPRLVRKKGKALREIFDVADRLCILTKAAQDELAKNSEGEGAEEEPCSSSPESSDSLLSATSAAS